MANDAWNYLTLSAPKEHAQELADELTAAGDEWADRLADKLPEASVGRSPSRSAVSYYDHGPNGTITIEFVTGWDADHDFIAALGTSTLFTSVSHEVEVDGITTEREWSDGVLTSSSSYTED